MFRYRLSIMAAAVILTAGASGAFAQNNQGNQPACSLSPDHPAIERARLEAARAPPPLVDFKYRSARASAAG